MLTAPGRTLTQLTAAHRFMLRHRFYAMALVSALACALLAGRTYLTDAWAYRFLVWNLFLAWLPYLGALWAASIDARSPGQLWRLALPAALWLLFLPNAPYLVTDLKYLKHMDFTWWYDGGLLMAFALGGLLLGAASLQAMQGIVAARLGRAAGWLFALAACGLCGLGVYIGRFLRWNSWDLLTRPHHLLVDIVANLADPGNATRVIGMTGLISTLLLVTTLTLAAPREQP